MAKMPTSSGTYCSNPSGGSEDSHDRGGGVRAAKDTSFFQSLLTWPIHVGAAALAIPFHTLTGNPEGVVRNVKNVIDYSPPARLAAEAERVQQHQESPRSPQGTASFGTGGTLATPYVDTRRPLSAPTAYATVGAQADAARDPTGCGFDGREGCPGGAEIDYKLGTIGSAMFKYPDPSSVRQAYAHMAAQDKRKLGKLIKQRHEAEIDLPYAERAYTEAKANGMDQSAVSELEEKVRSDKNTINSRNEQIKGIVKRYQFDEGDLRRSSISEGSLPPAKRLEFERIPEASDKRNCLLRQHVHRIPNHIRRRRRVM